MIKALSSIRKARRPLIKQALIEAVKTVSDKCVGFSRSEADLDSYRKQVIEAIRFSRIIPNENVNALDPVDLLNRYSYRGFIQGTKRLGKKTLSSLSSVT